MWKIVQIWAFNHTLPILILFFSFPTNAQIYTLPFHKRRHFLSTHIWLPKVKTERYFVCVHVPTMPILLAMSNEVLRIFNCVLRVKVSIYSVRNCSATNLTKLEFTQFAIAYRINSRLFDRCVQFIDFHTTASKTKGTLYLLIRFMCTGQAGIHIHKRAHTLFTSTAIVYKYIKTMPDHSNCRCRALRSAQLGRIGYHDRCMF